MFYIFTFSIRCRGNYSLHYRWQRGQLRQPPDNRSAWSLCRGTPCRGLRNCTCSESGSHSIAFCSDHNFLPRKIYLSYSDLLLSEYFIRTDAIIQRRHMVMSFADHPGCLLQLCSNRAVSICSSALQGLCDGAQAGERIPIGVMLIPTMT